MAKEWIINNVMNRFQLNFKRNVGATSKSVRECQPKSLEEWKIYYYDKVKSKDDINKLGDRLFNKIKSVIKKEKELEIKEKETEFYKNLLKKSIEAIKQYPELQRSRTIEEIKKSHREIEKHSKKEIIF